MEVSAAFLIDTIARAEGGWVGRVRVAGHVLFLCAACTTQEDAIQEARASLAAHLQMLFTGATDLDHQQQTERYDTLVELEAASGSGRSAGDGPHRDTSADLVTAIGADPPHMVRLR